MVIGGSKVVDGVMLTSRLIGNGVGMVMVRIEFPILKDDSNIDDVTIEIFILQIKKQFSTNYRYVFSFSKKKYHFSNPLWINRFLTTVTNSNNCLN